MQAKRRLGGLIAIVAVALLTLVLARHAVARFIITQGLGLATGYHFDIGEVRLQAAHGAFLNTHISKKGEPVLDAVRIDVYYNLRDLLPGSKHRFGFVGVAIDQPHLTVIHHQNGTYNISHSLSMGATGAPAATQTLSTPFDFYARIRHGSATLVDDYQFYKESRVQAVHNIDADFTTKTNDRTHYTVTASFVDTKDEPLRAVGTVDYHHGYAIHHFVAAAVPIKAIGNYFINSSAARIVAGTAKNFDARIYALDVKPGAAIQYHTSATLVLNDGQLYINGLALPLDNIRGGLQITDSGLAARALEATVAGLPLLVAGSIYDFSNPKFALGLQGRGDLRTLKTLVASGARYPLYGDTKIATLIEGPIANPLILVGFQSPRVRYDRFPVQDAHGVMALYTGIATIVPLQGRYGNLNVSVRGNATLGKHVDSQMAIAYTGNASDLPYLGALVPGSAIAGEAVASGTDTSIGVTGQIADAYDPDVMSGVYALSPRGDATIGPLIIHRKGGSLYGSYALDRAHRDVAFWVSARNFTIEPSRAASFPGLQLAQFNGFAGHVISADVAGAGAGSDIAVGGYAQAKDVRVAGLTVNTLGVDFAGPIGNVSIPRVHATGPWGNFSGNATYQNGAVAAGGNFNGSLDALPFASAGGARGHVAGPVAVAFQNNTLTLQTQGAQFNGVSVRGIPVQSFNGTVAFENGGVRVYSGRGKIAGADIVAGGTYGNGKSVAISTANAGPQTARALGLPLSAGTVALVGLLGSQGNAPTFDGGVAVTNGVALGYPVQGSSDVHLGAQSLNVQNATVTVNGTYGGINGDINNVHSGSPGLNLIADVPAADITTAANTLHFPTFGTTGSFGARLAIGGGVRAPSVRGPLHVPVGQVNGLGFEDASALLAASPGSISARNGIVGIGSTHAGFDAALNRRRTAVSFRSTNADLADFNDFFDTGDTLAGKAKRIAISVARSNLSIATSGYVDVEDFRYRRLPIGNTDATWSSHDGVVNGNLHVGGVHGMLHVAGSVALASEATFAQTVAHSRYDLAAQLHGLDLSTWLPAFGYPTLPVTGRVDATATLHGLYPQLALVSEATLRHGTAGSVPIDLLHMNAHSIGRSVALTHFDLQVPALVATGTGRFGLGKHDPINLTFSAQSSDLPTLAGNVLKTPLGIKGNLESQLTIGGTWAAPQLSAGVDLTKANVRGVEIPQLVASLGLRGRNLVVRNAEVTLAKGNVAIAGALPLQVAPFGIGPRHAPFSMDVFSTAADLSDFTALLPAGTKVGGLLNGHIAVNGSVDAPRINGAMGLSGGRYSGPIETAPVTQTVAQIVFHGTHATLENLHAQLGRGTLDGNGNIGFERGAAGTQLAYTVDAKTRSAVLNFPAYGSGTIDSDLRLTKNPGELAVLSGDVKARDAVIPFAAFVSHGTGAVGAAQDAVATFKGGPASAPDAAAPGFPFNLGFNLGVTAGKNVAVRASALGFGIDIGATGHALLAGSLAQPTLAGEFDASGGSLRFIDHVFKVQEGTVTFTPENGVIPQLYAIGTTHVTDPNPGSQIAGSADVTIKVTGPATNPTLSFSSDPPGLSRDQIIAMLTPLGLIGGLTFDRNGNAVAPGQLAGAPPQGSGQPLPPGAFRHQAGSLSIGQEAFNILNAQFAHSLLTPIENALGGTLGLSSVNLTVDYFGNVGVSARRPINRRLAGVYATNFGFPNRTTYGLQYAPSEYTVAQLTFFTQSSPTTFFGGNGGSSAVITDPNVTVGQPVNGNKGFAFSLQRLFW
ncbi:MAG: translocation/assembly module TamB [Candidatus Eremiobacteraeota bacterium]|nr:translocation/assembly module TamB [Candidatus Eremiobacteraeota bacterium]